VATSRAFVPSYDELYSISDLHLGGARPGGQIFCQGARLKSFLQTLAGKSGPLCLVIAGDLFDSLPYLTGSGTYVAIDGAADILQTIMDTPAFAPVFDGLKAFLRADGHELVVLIGNHDLEIALPEAQEALLRAIAPTNPARGRVRFSTGGVGFRCQVGDLTVYVSHGNEADVWNHVDHEALRRAAHARALGQTWDARAWVPNAGTKLVIDAMNAIKATHPFIDLLKPETGAALRVLRTIAPETVASFIDALPAFARFVRARVTTPSFVLGAEPARLARDLEVVQLLGDAARDSWAPSLGSTGGTALMDRVGQYHRDGALPASLVSDELTKLGVVSNLFKGASRPEALRLALRDWLDGDRSFALDDRDSTYREVIAQVGAGIDVVITGHTHLPRWIDARERGLTYLNAGAWARTMGLRPEFLASEAAFAPIYNALQSAELRDLDATTVNVDGEAVPLVLDATVAAHVIGSDRAAELVRIGGSGSDLTETTVDRTKSVLSWR
jgi:UDP-2,3-diacylglucosamine pyrophosphatase LpxH